MEPTSESYWSRVITELRIRQGRSQREFAECLAVDQTTISRWERNKALPSPRQRRVLRDMMRATIETKQDKLTKLRVQFAAWPTTLLKQGGLLLEMSKSVIPQLGANELHSGGSIYGHYGEENDEQVAAWERTGIFTGELAMTLSLNKLHTRQGAVYFRGMDTPYLSSTGDIWCLCELKRLTEDEYLAQKSQLGGTLISISYDQLQ